MRAHRASRPLCVRRELLGFQRVSVYNGSWIEWSNTDRPIEGGSAP